MKAIDDWCHLDHLLYDDSPLCRSVLRRLIFPLKLMLVSNLDQAAFKKDPGEGRRQSRQYQARQSHGGGCPTYLRVFQVGMVDQ